MEKLIFNSSMPFSGSELLQVILHQNPRIYGSVTSPMFEYQFGANVNSGIPEVRAQNTELMEEAFDNVCKGIAENYYEKVGLGRPVVIDKNRGWAAYYNWVERWNPDPKMICMVRDLRSVCASPERTYRANIHKPEARVEDNQELKNLTVNERAGYWLNSFPIGLALKRLQNDFQTKNSEKILYVRYEDLCSSPEETIKGIYDFIEEEPFEHDFKNIVKEIEEDDSHFGPYGKHTIKPEIEVPKPADWSDVFDIEISNEIRKSYEWYFKQFNY
jgi:sulfotransferase